MSDGTWGMRVEVNEVKEEMEGGGVRFSQTIAGQPAVRPPRSFPRRACAGAQARTP
jgi:hypothetical protein